MASAVYSQLMLCSLSLKRIATELERANELRSESSHPSDGLGAATIVVESQSDEEETLSSQTSASNQNEKRQQQLFDDDSCVRPKGGRTDAGSSKPVNFEGRKPTNVVKGETPCGSADEGFGNVATDEGDFGGL